MRRVTVVAVLLLSLTALSSRGLAQDARQRQAAAEAYDRGTAAYLEGAYEEAAQWFETAHRMAPAAPALMQAIRAHEHNENHARAATLALELSRAYRDDKAALDYASGIITKQAGALLHVEVACDQDCKLDIDGKLQEFLSFFTTPSTAHQLTATFESGSKKATVQGAAGETRSIEFEAPPPPTTPAAIPLRDIESDSAGDDSHAPLQPLYTWIGLGVTGALGIATIISGVDARAGVPEYIKAATASTECMRGMQPADCAGLQANARSLLKAGEGRELRTNVLIGVTAFAAVGTGVVALFLTDWSGSDSGSDKNATGSSAWLEVQPQPGGVMSVLKGRF
jgi:tetratricopeptide (TPR) repeat protein